MLIAELINNLYYIDELIPSSKNERALALRMKEHQANCRRSISYRLFVGIPRAKVINTQLNTYRRKIAESLLMKKRSVVEIRIHFP